MVVFQQPRSRLRLAPGTLLLLPLLLLLVVLMMRSTYILHNSQHAVSMRLNGDDVPGGSSAAARRRLPAEVWAGFVPSELSEGAKEVYQLLNSTEKRELENLCGRCLYEQLKMSIGFGNGHKYFVSTGDIPSMWIRDSAVQLAPLMPRMSKQPALRMLVEGAVRTQAFFIIQDPYANAYNLKWQFPNQQTKDARLLGRGGWVATRNYELDSGAYFIHMLWNLYSLPGYARTMLLAEPTIFEAVNLLVDVWTTEQYHEERSTYRYSELPRDGMGPPVNYTGMSWSGFRPSDDPQVYGYNVPVNMYAQAAVERALLLNDAIWRSASFAEKAGELARTIREGIETWGIVEVEKGVKMYAYEVDGLGNTLVDYDDANVPSLLSIPLLGYAYNPAIYNNTRARILSPKNPYFFEGKFFKGIGSLHTPNGMAWPLALAVQGLTSHSVEERALMLRTLLKLQCGNGLMHESVDVNELMSCTRPWFGWANSMLVALVEAATGLDCSISAERQRLGKIMEREAASTSMRPTNGGKDNPLYYESLESMIVFDIDGLEPHEFGYAQTMSMTDEDKLMELINPAAQVDRSPGQTAAPVGGSRRATTAQEQAAVRAAAARTAAARAAAKAAARKAASAARKASPQTDAAQQGPGVVQVQQ